MNDQDRQAYTEWLFSGDPAEEDTTIEAWKAALEYARSGEAVGEVDGTGVAVIWSNKPLNGSKLFTHSQPTQPAEQDPFAYFDLQTREFRLAMPTTIDVPMSIKLEPVALYTHSQPAAVQVNEQLFKALRKTMIALQQTLPYMQVDKDGTGPDCSSVFQALLDAAQALGQDCEVTSEAQRGG